MQLNTFELYIDYYYNYYYMPPPPVCETSIGQSEVCV